MEYILKQIKPGDPNPLRISLEKDKIIGRSTIKSMSGYTRVSRRHALFTWKDGSWYITDFNSLNQLYVNFTKVEKPTKLDVGDIISLGAASMSEEAGFICVLTSKSVSKIKREPVEVRTVSSNICETLKLIQPTEIQSENKISAVNFSNYSNGVVPTPEDKPMPSDCGDSSTIKAEPDSLRNDNGSLSVSGQIDTKNREFSLNMSSDASQHKSNETQNEISCSIAKVYDSEKFSTSLCNSYIYSNNSTKDMEHCNVGITNNFTVEPNATNDLQYNNNRLVIDTDLKSMVTGCKPVCNNSPLNKNGITHNNFTAIVNGKSDVVASNEKSSTNPNENDSPRNYCRPTVSVPEMPESVPNKEIISNQVIPDNFTVEPSTSNALQYNNCRRGIGNIALKSEATGCEEMFNGPLARNGTFTAIVDGECDIVATVKKFSATVNPNENYSPRNYCKPTLSVPQSVSNNVRFSHRFTHDNFAIKPYTSNPFQLNNNRRGVGDTALKIEAAGCNAMFRGPLSKKNEINAFTTIVDEECAIIATVEKSATVNPNKNYSPINYCRPTVNAARVPQSVPNIEIISNRVTPDNFTVGDTALKNAETGCKKIFNAPLNKRNGTFTAIVDGEYDIGATVEKSSATVSLNDLPRNYFRPTAQVPSSVPIRRILKQDTPDNFTVEPNSNNDLQLNNRREIDDTALKIATIGCKEMFNDPLNKRNECNTFIAFVDEKCDFASFQESLTLNPNENYLARPDYCRQIANVPNAELFKQTKPDNRIGCRASNNKSHSYRKNGKDYVTKRTLNCYVSLMKCDSHSFPWPYDVKRIDFSKLLPSMSKMTNKSTEIVDRNLQNLKALATENMLSPSRKSLENKRVELNPPNLFKKINFRLKRNRILSSDSSTSEETDDEISDRRRDYNPLESSDGSETSGFNSSHRYLEQSSTRTLPNGILDSSLSIKRTRAGIKKTSKRLRLKETEESDSSLSSHDEILYSFSKRNTNQYRIPKINRTGQRNPSKIQDSHYQVTNRAVTVPSSSKNGNPRLNTYLSREKSKLVGRTLLTEPKPMQRRSRGRPREKLFPERCSLPTSNILPSEHTRVCGRKLSENKHHNSDSTGYNKYNYCEKYMKQPEKTHNDEHFQKHQTQFNLNVNRVLKSQIDSSLGGTRPNPPVPKRSSSYGSRMGFLVDMQEKSKSDIFNKNLEKESNENKNRQNTIRSTKYINSSVSTANENKSKQNIRTISSRDEQSRILEVPRKENFKNKVGLLPTPDFNPISSLNTKFNKEQPFKNKVGLLPIPDMYLMPLLNVKDNKEHPIKYKVGLLPIPHTNHISSNKINTEHHRNSQMISNLKCHNTNRQNTSELGQTSKRNICPLKLVGNTFSGTKCNEVNKSNVSKENKKVAIVPPINHNSVEERKNSNYIEMECLTYTGSSRVLDSRSLIEKIIIWNPKWLEEQKTRKKAPPIISKGARPLPLSFPSYESYARSFFPMIVLDTWESLFKETEHIPDLENINWNNFYYIVRTSECKKGVMEIQCESLVSEMFSFHPKEGNIVLLDLKENEHDLGNCIFGYIHGHKVEELKKDNWNISDWDKVPASWLTDAKLWTFNVCVKKTWIPPSEKYVYLGHGILNIRLNLQLADALRSFRSSTLQSNILQPIKESFSFCSSPRSGQNLSHTRLIEEASDEIMNEESSAKVVILRGPTGSGKTNAVVNLIEKLLCTNRGRLKITVCSPSSSTTDEIGCRLIELNERCSWRDNSIRFVRFGPPSQILSKIQSHSLDRKVCRMYRENTGKESEGRRSEIEILESQINKVLFRENFPRQPQKIDNKELQNLLDRLQVLKEQNVAKPFDPIIRKNYENSILKDSDVALLTLDNWGHPQLSTFFESKTCESTIRCCIVDEASQCTELAILQCLSSELDKLVLIGDFQQMPPPVVSKHAIRCGFDRSMLERFCIFFQKKFEETLHLTLKKQYRMHSEICHFPSKYFYNRELSTAAGIDNIYQYFPLKPYIVYDIMEKSIVESTTKSSAEEALVIAYICAQLVQVAPFASIGIIVTAEEQAILHSNSLSLNAAFRKIEINTVEKYQGREKDIIVLSCIRISNSVGEQSLMTCEKSLNVALTRARKCLIVCGHISSLMQYQHWSALLEDAKDRNAYICVQALTHIPVLFAKTINKK